MAKVSITKTEAIPFREVNWDIMQMKQHEISVTVTQEEWESVEDIEFQLNTVFTRNIEKTMSTDAIYQRQKDRLNYLVGQIKILSPAKAKNIILATKKI